jgi:hypothetical protein
LYILYEDKGMLDYGFGNFEAVAFGKLFVTPGVIFTFTADEGGGFELELELVPAPELGLVFIVVVVVAIVGAVVVVFGSVSRMGVVVFGATEISLVNECYDFMIRITFGNFCYWGGFQRNCGTRCTR